MKPLTKKQIRHVRQWLETVHILKGTSVPLSFEIDFSSEKKAKKSEYASQYEFLPLTRITTFVVSREFISEAKQLVENMKRYGIIKESERINFDVIPETK
jgi:hypothetical protein